MPLIANETELIDCIQHLGTQNIRAKRLINLSEAYLRDPPRMSDPRPSKPIIFTSYFPSTRDNRRYPPTPISHLPGTGSYALDSYRIFCNHYLEEWKAVMPDDKELVRYLVESKLYGDFGWSPDPFVLEMEMGV